MSATVIVETLRRHFAHIAYVGALLLIVIVAATAGAMDAPAGSGYGLLFNLLILLAGCQLIGPEFSKGTLQLILSKPIHRSRYLLSRVAGVVIALWVAIALAFITEIVARLVAHKAIDMEASGNTATSVAAHAVLVCSMLAFFGSFTRSYLNVAIHLGGQIVFSMLVGMLAFMRQVREGTFAAIGALLRDHPGVIDFIRDVSQNLYPSEPAVPFDRNWHLMVFGNAAVALLLACLVFRKREVPYGAD